MSANSKDIDDLVKKIRRQKFIEEQEEEELAKKAAKQQNMEEDDDAEQEEDNEQEDNEQEDNEQEDNKREDNERKRDKQEDKNKSEKSEKKAENNNNSNVDKPKDETVSNKSETTPNREKFQSQTSTQENSIKTSSNMPNSVASESSGTTTGTGAGATGTGATGAGTAGAGTAGAGTAGAGTAGAGTAGAGAAGAGTAGAGTAGAGAAGAGAAGAGAAGAGAAGAGAAGAGIGLAGALGIVLIVILIIIILIGIIFFFITMPGMVIGRIGTAINDWRKSVDGFLNGDEYASILVGKKEVAEAAQYLSQMGYDLDGYGFLSSDVKDQISAKVGNGFFESIEKWWNDNDEDNSKALAYGEFSKESASKRKVTDDEEYHNLYLSKKYNPNDDENTTKENILLATTKDGEVKFAKSKYLAMYLTADNAVYLVRNYNTDLLNRAAKLIGMNDVKEGSGLISFRNASDIDASKYIKNANGLSFSDCEDGFMLDRVAVYRANKVMRVYNTDDGLFRQTWYDFNMDGWSSKYGVPLQLSLAMHLSSLAPDFAYEVAKIGAEDTVVEMGLLKVGGNTRKMLIELDIDEDGTDERYYLESNTAVRIHVDGNGNDEEGYDTINDALNSDFADYDETKDKEEQKENAKKQMKKTLDEVEEDLKKETDDGKKPIEFGKLGYCYFNVNGSEGEWNKLNENDYYISINKENEFLKKFVNALTDNNILYIDKDKNNRLKKCDGADTTKAKEIFRKYFYIAGVKDLLSEFKQSNATAKTMYNEGGATDAWEYKYDKVVNSGREGTMTIHYTARRFTVDDTWNWYFEGSTDITFSTNILTELFGGISKHFPVRTYYKLVNADTGEVVKYKNEKEDLKASDFVAADSGNTFYNDSENTGEFWRRMIPNKIAKAVLKAIGESTENMDQKGDQVSEILDKMDDTSVEDYTRYVPMILEVENHWYQDETFEGAYEWKTDESSRINTDFYTANDTDSDSIKKAAEKKVLYVNETTSGKVKKVKNNATKKGEAGKKIRDLLKEKYYIYDGTRKSKTKEKINFANTAVDAIAMLEQIQGEDAQDIIRMFRELMSSYNIFFEEAKGTKEKKELFKNVIKDYSNSDNLLTDGDDCVYRAHIDNVQEGFEEDLVVQAPCNGKITYKTEDAICIEIDDKDGTFNKYSILISGFNVTIKENVGQTVKEGTQLGKTIRQDLKLVLRDDKGAIVKNEYEVIVGDPSTPDNGLGEGAEKSSNIEGDSSESESNASSSGSTDTRVAKKNPVYTTKQLQNIFGKYNNGKMGSNLVKYSNDFYTLQTKYGVNPLFAAAVAIKEQSAGTANSSLSRNNNWFSIRSTKGGWKVYNSPSESIDDFGWTIAKGSHYYTQGKYTIYEIGQQYCKPPDEWVKGVSDIMKKLEKLK